MNESLNPRVGHEAREKELFVVPKANVELFFTKKRTGRRCKPLAFKDGQIGMGTVHDCLIRLDTGKIVSFTHSPRKDLENYSEAMRAKLTEGRVFQVSDPNPVSKLQKGFAPRVSEIAYIEVDRLAELSPKAERTFTDSIEQINKAFIEKDGAFIARQIGAKNDDVEVSDSAGVLGGE